MPHGHAIRILTGAALPQGVDTVILQEDVTASDTAIAFHPGIKPGANTRKAGEDVSAGDTILSKGRKLTPTDLALLSATGNTDLTVHAPCASRSCPPVTNWSNRAHPRHPARFSTPTAQCFSA